jgi:spore coat protein CotH
LLSAQAANPSASLFAQDRILQIDIRWHQAWRECLSYRDATDETLSKIGEDAYEYRRGDVVIDGAKIAQVGIRKKGFLGSVVSTRPSLKIKFDEYVSGQSHAGLDGLTLNNNNQDQTFVQQHLAYDLFARAGVPAPRTSFAHVRVNGEDLGVYTHVEAINKSLLRRVFGNSNGVLYESYAGDFSDDRFYRIVEKSGAASQDRSALAALKDVLAVTGPVSIPRVEALVDLDGFMRLWAAESLMGPWDGYSQPQPPTSMRIRHQEVAFHQGADRIFVDPVPCRRWWCRSRSKPSGCCADDCRAFGDQGPLST